MLWGSHAQAKRPLIEAAGRQHLVLSSNHPSPLSARRPPVPFVGNGHFRAARDFLGAADPGAARFDWSLP
jgi:uracil-DNA glycosylase